MPKKKKKAVVPRLRFPEFRDAGEWEVKRLGEVGKISTGKTPLTGDQDSWNGETPWITPTDINGAKRISNSERKLTKKGAITAGLLPKDAVLVTCIASIGKNAILDVPGSCNQQINAIISKNGFNPDFIFYLIEKNSITMTNLAGGSSPAIIPKREFESLRLPFPDLPEQQKISDCLSSLDDLIRAGEAQLVALKDHKKGLMQQLFPREGETTPRLRFPEFRDAGEWEVKRLGEVAAFHKGKGVSKSDISPDGVLPCIRYGELYTRYLETISDVVSHTNISSDDLLLSNANDVIIPASGETSEDIATASCVLHAGIALGGDLNIIRSSMNGVFLSYYLNSVKKHTIARIAQGNSVVHLYPAQLAKLELCIPSVIEQQKIADCLTSLDDLIRAEEVQLVALKDHKKGLMQQLFPQEVG